MHVESGNCSVLSCKEGLFWCRLKMLNLCFNLPRRYIPSSMRSVKPEDILNSSATIQSWISKPLSEWNVFWMVLSERTSFVALSSVRREIQCPKSCGMMSYRPGPGCCDVRSCAQCSAENILLYHEMSPITSGKTTSTSSLLFCLCLCCAVILASLPPIDKSVGMDVWGYFCLILFISASSAFSDT